jgi:uncharacterized protein YqgC (DUF456 family)
VIEADMMFWIGVALIAALLLAIDFIGGRS